MPNDFEAFAKTALGTDNPEQIEAFKQAIMACMDAEEGGEYEEEAEAGAAPAAKGSLAALFGKG